MGDPRSRHVQAVVMVFALALAPHVSDLPVWVVGWCLLLWGWALAAGRLGWPQPSFRVRLILLAGGLAGAMADYFPYELWRLEFASTVLAVLLGVKALELTSTRSRMASLFLAHFLVATKLLDTITLEMAVYVLAVVLLSTAAMARLNSPLSRRAALAAAGGIMLRALPLIAALFLFFPRADGGLSWRFGLARSTGFSETLSPGNLAALVRNTAPAFRVAFQGPVPPPDQRYWRGVVLWNFDGGIWRSGGQGALRTRSVQALSTVDYALTMEPHLGAWVFSLDAPVQAPDGLWLSSDLSLSVRGRVASRRTFALRSAVERHTGPPLPSDARGLRLPGDAAPRTVALGRSWSAQGLSADAAVEAAMALFRTGGFTYSIDPPAVRGDPTDGFLFGTRSGYCGHYASAMALLLRAAGVPTRLVLGYQGGELNPLGDFLTVRQSEAHAWCEVLLPDRGWVRVDPTTAVAPTRTTQGVGAMFAGSQAADQENWARDRWARALDEVSVVWDAVRYRLDPWITDLGPDAQSDLLSGLGLGPRGFGRRLAALAGAVGLAAVLILFRPWGGLPRRRATTAEKAHRVYLRFCSRLARADLPRAPWQGPMDYAAMVAARRPDLADKAARVAAVYAGLRYGSAKPRDLVLLRRLVRRFHP